MGFSKKHQIEIGNQQESPEAQKWVIAGIAIMAPLKQINTKPSPSPSQSPETIDEEEEEEEAGGANSTTPTARESRIPEKLPCPPAPRKRRPSPAAPTCHSNGGGVREFFNPPDLESVFIGH
ncbi:cyclin-dependent protein kinase inhibitor SMR6-like [Andrographis paniculata]|uniref:cyclin-dependent protein kinase inhibitor SMR6-like n=1 Tax=Andrographis paniculata TaxID=175694 RepID=UPI0021E860C3|nr:cyclin-dependent protein kinase inhibitor SMR6-like [Andrographis paniculata]